MQPPPSISIPGFLGARREPLLDFALARESDFQAATVTLGAGARAVVEGVRRARILHTLGAFEEDFLRSLKAHVEPAQVRLAQPAFSIGRIEAQITASNDGDYFRRHQDGGYDDTRQISYVYFLHSEPRRFQGGELRVLDQTVQPEGDTLILFPSISAHEVLPLSVPSRAFRDSRFTVNGWIHRAK